jgi:integrase
VRKRRDGAPAAPVDRRRLTELHVKRAKPTDRLHCTWDLAAPGLVLRTSPSGHKSWRVYYRRAGRSRWYTVGDARVIPLSEARRASREILVEVARGKDPQAERRAARVTVFEELVARYCEYAKGKNKSWRQTDAIIRHHTLPWMKLDARSIRRSDVRALVNRIEGAAMHNQVLASASAIFGWAVKQEIIEVNPCSGVERRAAKSRERILSDIEIVSFWKEFDTADLVAGGALKILLLTAQRSVEVAHMRHEDIAPDGWWVLKGETTNGAAPWCGTKNKVTSAVFLTPEARSIIAEVDDGSTGYVFKSRSGRPVEDLDAVMRRICKKLGVDDRATTHDLRRTCASLIVRLGSDRTVMDKVLNHRNGKDVGAVYDRYSRRPEIERAMSGVTQHVMSLINLDHA